MRATTNARSENRGHRLADLPKVPIERLDYKYVDECEDETELRDIIAVLESGKEGLYPQLVQHTEKKLLSILSPKERTRYRAMKYGASHAEKEEAVSDLDSWLCSISSTDRALSVKSGPDAKSGNPKDGNIFSSEETGSSASTSNRRSLPPVRGQQRDEDEDDDDDEEDDKLPTKSADSKTNERKSRDSKAKPFKQYYREWEKYDVDKELHKIQIVEDDAAEARKEAQRRRAQERQQRLANLKKLGIKPEDIELMSNAEKSFIAENEKRKGNECYRSGEYEEAVHYYSRSTAFMPSAIVYANRAMTYIKMNRFDDAIRDCSDAISLDPTYLKAISRRAMALHRQGRYVEAVLDFHKATQLANTNTSLRSLLEKSRDKLYEVEGDDASAMLKDAGLEAYCKGGRVRGSKSNGFTRLCIEESDSSEEEEEEEEKEEGESVKIGNDAPAPIERCAHGMSLIEASKYASAIRAFDAIIENDARSAEAYVGRAIARIEGERNVSGLTQAICDCSVALVIAGSGNAAKRKSRVRALVMRARARHYLLQINDDNDEEEVKSQIESDLAEARETDTQLCAQLLSADDDNIRPKTSKIKASKEPLTSNDWKQRGNEKIAQRDLDGAVSCYRESLRIDPTNAAASANLAVAYNRLEKWSDAVVCCRAGLANSRDCAKLRLKLLYRCAFALFHVGDRSALQEAANMLKCASREEPENDKLSALSKRVGEALLRIAVPLPSPPNTVSAKKSTISFASTTNESPSASPALIPRSAYDFRRMWRSLSSKDDDTKCRFLLGLKAKTLRKIFGRSFEPDVLEDILITLAGSNEPFASAENSLRAINFLATCTSLKGFQTAKLMMGLKGSESAKEITLRLQANLSDEKSRASISGIEKAFGL